MDSQQEMSTDFDALNNLEWLETNGIGGYASGTVSGCNSRRYHGLLVAATQPPVGRMVLLNKLDETLLIGEKFYDLGTNQYPGALHPKGFNYLNSFERDLFPEFNYEVGGIAIKKTIAAIWGENTTVVLYDVLRAARIFEMQLLPLYATRDFHGMSHANDYIGQPYVFDNGSFRTLNYHGCPELFISVPGAQYKEMKAWYYNLEYRIEQQRGLDFREDLYTHGKFCVRLKEGDRLGIIVSTSDPTGRDAIELFETERKRRETVKGRFPSSSELQRLTLAADQFIVKRGDHSSIIAGYHWFADWGRDTMISLPGLCLTTGRFDDAKKILKEFALHVSDGMLPNRFPDQGEAPEYNTIDATLWFFNAIYSYYRSTGDKMLVKEMVPVLIEIVKWHYKGTRYNIKVDAMDGLLSGGAEGVQLTWMDAKVGNWVVTPRRGKAIEINALWYNALSIVAYFLEELNQTEEAETFRSSAQQVSESFNRTFWNTDTNSLYDYVSGDEKNTEIRPNQIFAASLPFKVLTKDRASRVLETVTKHLLTPKGLRSLAASDKNYQSAYSGTVMQRDGAYHQGTVWSFLIGPYIDALIFVNGERGKRKASEILKEFLKPLDEAGIGTISEISDAEPPFTPRGCIAQAWGVAEVLRVAVEYGLLDNGLQEKKKEKVAAPI